MTRTQQELITTIHATQAELELMAGYEATHPEHYQQLVDSLKIAQDEYARAMSNNAPYSARVEEAPPTQAGSAPQATPKRQSTAGSKGNHVAQADTIRVAGRGDKLLLLHWEEEEAPPANGANGGQTSPAPRGQTGGAKPPSAAAQSPTAQPPAAKPPTTAAKPPAPSGPPAEDSFPVGPPAPQSLQIVKVDADKWKDGYGNMRLRSDVAELFNQVRAEANRRGAIITSSGGVRDLNAQVGASRSATSFHYSGRALDMYIYSGMGDPKTDPFVIVREAACQYRVYARCSAEHAEMTELSQVMTYHKRNGSLTASGSFFDLTALFDEHGFKPIRARKNFESGGDQLGAEWWHFQCERGLVKGKSTFGEELLAVYSEEVLKKSPPWEYRNYVFGVNWN